MKFRKITALLLVLCMLLSLSISVFAAEADEHTIYDSAPDEEPVVSSEAATSGTIQNSGIRWSLDEKGWLTISGSGEAPVFQSADDQPWAAVRDQITEVWFEDVETLTIPDLAYWFEGCVNLTTAELPLAPTIGKHAFYNCPKLSTLTMYYGETVLNSIGEDAFWREADSGDTLYIAYIIGYPEATVPFYTYDWAASNRSNRYFYDLYGVYPNADTANTAVNTASVSGIQKAPGISLTASTGIVGTCPSCKQYSLQGTYVSTTHTSRGHAEYYCISTDAGDLVFYIIKPTNISVLPAGAVSAKIRALQNTLSAQAGVELLAMNSRESFNATCLFYHDRMQAEQNPAIRELLEQDRAFLDEKQVQMTLAREFYLAVRLKNEKPDTAYTLLSTIETKFRDNGFTTRRAGKEDLKRLLAIYFEQNTTTERFEDYDGQRFMEATG